MYIFRRQSDVAPQKSSHSSTASILQTKSCLRGFGLIWSKFQKMIVKRLKCAQSLSCIGRHTHSQMGHCDDPQLVNHHIGSLTWYPGMAPQILKLPQKLNMPCHALMCEIYPGQCATNPLDCLNFVQFREEDREEGEGEEAERKGLKREGHCSCLLKTVTLCLIPSVEPQRIKTLPNLANCNIVCISSCNSWITHLPGWKPVSAGMSGMTGRKILFSSPIRYIRFSSIWSAG